MRGVPVKVSDGVQDVDGELVGFSNGDDLLSLRSSDGEVLVGMDSGFPQTGGRMDDRGQRDIFLILIGDQGICFIVFYLKRCSLVVNGRVRSRGARSGSMRGQWTKVWGMNTWDWGVSRG